MISDKQLWNFFRWPCAPSPEPSDEWVAQVKAAILSDDIPTSGMTGVDAARYICRLLRVKREAAFEDMLASRRRAELHVSGDSLRAAFVRGIALRGGDPMEASLLYAQGIEEALQRGLVEFDEISFPLDPRDWIVLTGAGDVVAETVLNEYRSKTASPGTSQMPAAGPDFRKGGHKSSWNIEDFHRRLDTIENELRRLPQNLCMLVTHTPLTREGSRYSLFEGDRHQLGKHWLSEGDLPNYTLTGQPPEMFPFGMDPFPFGVVLSRTSSLLDLAVDAEDCTWLNFGGDCGFYVSCGTVRDSLPEGKVAHELTERIIWHYFDKNTGPIPEASTFESEYKQLLHCYRATCETWIKYEDQLSLGDELTRIIYELEWPEVLLYLGFIHSHPFLRVEHESVIRSFQGEPLVPFVAEDYHDVYRIWPASVARATSYTLEVLRRMVHAVDKPSTRLLKADTAEESASGVVQSGHDVTPEDSCVAYDDDLRNISAGLEAAIDAAESMFQHAQELAIKPKWDLKKSDLRDWFDAIAGHLADGAGDGLAVKLGLLATVSQITDPTLGDAILKSSPASDGSIDSKIEWVNRELAASGRSPVSAWVSVIPQVPGRVATVTGKTRCFLSWHEAALSIARKLLAERLQPRYTLESWLSCWAKTKWQRILAGVREERLFLERSNAFAGAKPVSVLPEVTGTISLDAVPDPESRPPAAQPLDAESCGDPPSGFLGGSDLTNTLGIHPSRRNAFFKKLERNRNSLGDDCWLETSDPRPNAPLFYYRADSQAVKDIAANYKTPKPA